MVKFIADAGANHNKDMNRVSALIDAAERIGCEAIKFQYYKADRLYAPEFRRQREDARTGELPDAFIPGIAALCKRARIEFHCTPFHVNDVRPLIRHVDALKIASYSILDIKLIKACAKSGKPLGVSTGGATRSEVYSVLDMLREEKLITKYNLTFYYCIPEYPAKPHPGLMSQLLLEWGSFNFNKGYSDHTRNTTIMLAAIAAGARAVEFHLDLDDGAGMESRHGHCWTVSEAAAMIKTARTFYSVLFDDEHIAPDYTDMRRWRADAVDEARPQRKYRQELAGK